MVTSAITKRLCRTKMEKKVLEHGVVIVATGAYENKPKEYLYGQNASVKTQRELEVMIYEKDSKLAAVKNVVMIQCVGSRDKERTVLQPLLLL